MNTNQLKTLVDSLKVKLVTTEPPTDAEFLEMAFHARHVDSEMMFDFFEGKLDADDRKTIEECISKSNLFLENLVGIGELVLERKRSETSQAHPRFSVLLAWIKDRLSSTIAESTKQHVDQCISCHKSAQSMLSALFQMQFAMRNRQLAAADSSASINLTETNQEGLSWSIVEDGDKLIFDLKSRNQKHQLSLVYLMLASDQGEPDSRIALLAPDLQGWFSAIVEFERSDMQGKYQAFAVPIENRLLTESELPNVVAAISRDEASPERLSHWKNWLAKLQSDGADSEIIQRLESCL